jgi:hypothetical protein
MGELTLFSIKLLLDSTDSELSYIEFFSGRLYSAMAAIFFETNFSNCYDIFDAGGFFLDVASSFLDLIALLNFLLNIASRFISKLESFLSGFYLIFIVLCFFYTFCSF